MRQLSERTLLLLLAAVQFTHIVDFMILMPLGPQLMRDLHLSPSQFSHLVAAYTISSGIVGLLSAPFIDRFDRRKLLLFSYSGFILGTTACGLAQSSNSLFAARTFCGAFGGFSMSMVMSIVGDVVPAQRRAAALGVVMTAFSVAAALGVPFGLQLAQHFSWETPFFVLASIASITWIVAYAGLPPVRGHLAGGQTEGAFKALLRDANAGRAVLFMASTVLGHFTIIPLMSPHFVGDCGLPEKYLFLVYFIGGVLTVFTAPTIGRLADKHGRLLLFRWLVVIASCVTLVITNTGPIPVWASLLLAGMFFVFASGRFVPAQAIMTLAVPSSRRGAFMSLSGCARDLTMGITSTIGGAIVSTAPNGGLINYHWLGWIAVAAGALSMWLGGRVHVNEGAKPPLTPIQSVEV
ncbi:MAG: Purine efflux pump PbuE [Verrucomicrobiota bacterium]|jgi:predicted MFS family arabinose efflux permease